MSRRVQLVLLVALLSLGMVAGTNSAQSVVQSAQPAGSSEITEWELVVPEGAIEVKHFDLAPRVKAIDGLRIGLYWNGKPNGDAILSKIGELLTKQFKDVKITRFWEIYTHDATGSAQRYSYSPETFKKMAASVDLVIASQAD